MYWNLYQVWPVSRLHTPRILWRKKSRLFDWDFNQLGNDVIENILWSRNSSFLQIIQNFFSWIKFCFQDEGTLCVSLVQRCIECNPHEIRLDHLPDVMSRPIPQNLRGMARPIRRIIQGMARPIPCIIWGMVWKSTLGRPYFHLDLHSSPSTLTYKEYCSAKNRNRSFLVHSTNCCSEWNIWEVDL